ncbi:MAG: hypothetical protein QM572_08750 [Nocardioides sp.]|uniref:hypothetical protein n=1 Tax=Nocardioides sp. TaxID=35761 RepID=UPI0039E2B662
MRISEREATDRLNALTGLTRTPARRLLGTNIAGSPTRGPGGQRLYDMAAVDDLGRRGLPDDAWLAEWLRFGLLHVRLAPSVEWDVGWSAEETCDRLRGCRPTGIVRLIQLVGLVRDAGRLPIIATVSGFVVGGADLVDPVIEVDGADRGLALTTPGAWYSGLAAARWPSPRGGAPLRWHDPAGWRFAGVARGDMDHARC